MQEYTITRAQVSDTDRIRKFLSQNQQSPKISIHDQSIFMTAASGDDVVGVAGAELNSPNALVRSTGVSHSWRSHGIASELICELFRVLRQNEISELFLFSTDAGAFWTKKGFRQCPINELITELPEAPQVKGYIDDGSIWSEVTWRRKLGDIVYHYELSDDEFEKQFCDATLSPALFSHEAHLRLAWLHLKKYGIDAAITHITSQLKNYVEHWGAKDKYNEPLTIAAIRCVDALRKETLSSGFLQFIRVNGQLKKDFKTTVSPYLQK
jgi:N-acetylglutamate synthase-like GNAT family acetyltransferase